jgi:hypothetical protein
MNIFDDSIIFKLVNNVNSYRYENGTNDETVGDFECSSTCISNEESPPLHLTKTAKNAGCGGPQNWPPQSTDLNPLGFICEDTSMILLMSTRGSHVRTSNCNNISVNTHNND